MIQQRDMGGQKVDFEWFPGTRTWHFAVRGDPRIVGGGQKTLEECELAAAEEIKLVLGDES